MAGERGHPRSRLPRHVPRGAPDPVLDPGITHQGAGDRIDYVYAAGPVDTLDSQLVGEEGGRGVDIGFDQWTSDHRAVLSTFDVTPVPMRSWSP